MFIFIYFPKNILFYNVCGCVINVFFFCVDLGPIHGFEYSLIVNCSLTPRPYPLTSNLTSKTASGKYENELGENDGNAHSHHTAQVVSHLIQLELLRTTWKGDLWLLTIVIIRIVRVRLSATTRTETSSSVVVVLAIPTAALEAVLHLL